MKKCYITILICFLHHTIGLAQLDANSVMGTPHFTTLANMNGVTTASEGSIAYNEETQKLYIFDGTNWVSTTNDNWSVDGNTGLSATNFLGHTDDVPMEIRSNNLPMLQFGRRQTLGLTQGFPDYTDNDQPLVYMNGNGNVAALQFAAAGASFYKPMFFTTANGSFRLKGSTGGTDLFEIGSGGPANDGRLEFIIGDDGAEPIIFKRYDYRSGQFHTELFRVQGSNNSSTAKPRFGININPQQVPVDSDYDDSSAGFNIANSTFQVNGSVSKSILATTGNLTLTEDHHTIVITGSHSITLPTASTCEGRVYILKNRTNANRTISTYRDQANSNTTTIPSETMLTIQSDGTDWEQINNIGGSSASTIVSTDANNDITTGTDSGAFFDSPIKAMGKVAANGNAIRIQGATVRRIQNPGRYRVTLSTTRATDDYIIQLSLVIQSLTDMNATVFNQTTNSFEVYITDYLGDRINREWFFTVMDF